MYVIRETNNEGSAPVDRVKILGEWAWFVGFPLFLLRVAPRVWRSQAYKRGIVR